MNSAATMRGLVFDPRLELDVELREGLARPVPRAGEVLVRVTHTTVNGHEFELADNATVRAMGWLRGAPGEVRTGLEFAGVVESQGGVFGVGQRVIGYVDVISGWKPHAEYVAISEAFLARAPETVSLAEASTLPMGAQTALVAIREVAGLRAGQRLLLLGASGGLGVNGLQIAHLMGVHVTAMASGRHRERLRELGADVVLDYRETTLASITDTYDAVLDFSSTAWLRDVRHLLGDRGVFVPADPMRNLFEILTSRRARWLLVDRGDTGLLSEISEWVDDGKLTPIVSETFGVDDWREAVARSHVRGRLGRTVLAFGEV
jgi:NADPH:quinone reductase-like Zn-dependent oxidoreductase